MSNCILLKKGGASIAANQIKEEISKILINDNVEDSSALDIAAKILTDFNIIASTNSESIYSTEDLIKTISDNIEENNSEVPGASSDASVASLYIDSTPNSIIIQLGGMKVEYSKLDYYIPKYKLDSYLNRAKDLYFQLRYDKNKSPYEALEMALVRLSIEMENKIDMSKNNPSETGLKLNEDGLIDEDILKSFSKDLEIINSILDSNPDLLVYRLANFINMSGIEKINISLLDKEKRDKLLEEEKESLQKEETIDVSEEYSEDEREYVNDNEIEYKTEKDVKVIEPKDHELESIIEEKTEEEIQTEITDLENASELENAEGKQYDKVRGEEQPRIDPYIASRLSSIAKKTYAVKDGKIIYFDAINPDTGFKIYADSNYLLRIILENFTSISKYSIIPNSNGNTDVFDKLKLKIEELAKINPVFINVLSMLNEFSGDSISKSKFVTSLFLQNIEYIDVYKKDAEDGSKNFTVDVVNVNKYNKTKSNFFKKIINIFKSMFFNENKEIKINLIRRYKARIEELKGKINGNVEDVFKVTNILNTLLKTEISPILLYNEALKQIKDKNPEINSSPNKYVESYLKNILSDFSNMFFNESIKYDSLEFPEFTGILGQIIDKYLKVSNEQSDNMLIGPNGKVYSKANPMYSEVFLDQLIHNPSEAQEIYTGIMSGKLESNNFLWAKFYKSLNDLSISDKHKAFQSIKTLTLLQDRVYHEDGSEDFKTRKNRTAAEFATNQLAITLNYLLDKENLASYPNLADKSLNIYSSGEPNTLLDSNEENSILLELYKISELLKQTNDLDFSNTELFKKVLSYSEAEAIRFLESFDKLNDPNETTNNVMGKFTERQYPYIYNGKVIYLTKKEGDSLNLKIDDSGNNQIRIKGFVKIIGLKGDTIVRTNTLQEAIDLGLTNIRFLGNAFSNFFYNTMPLEDSNLFELDKKHGYYKPKKYDSIYSWIKAFRSSELVKDKINKSLILEFKQIEEYLANNKTIKIPNNILDKISHITNVKDLSSLRRIYLYASFMKYKFDQIERSYLYGGGVEYYKNSKKEKEILKSDQNLIADVATDYSKRIYATSSSGIRPYLEPGQESKIKTIIINDVVYKSEMGEDTDATDGGGYIYYLDAVKFRKSIGKLTKRENDLISKLEKGEEISEVEMDFLFQPIKPFFFNLEKSGPLLIKNAWTIVTPWLGKNTRLPVLRKIYDLMESTGIHLVLPASNVKVGIHNAVDISNIDSDNKYDIINFSKQKNAVYREQLLEASFDIDFNYFIEHTATPKHGVHEMELPRGIIENMISVLKEGEEVSIYDIKSKSIKSVSSMKIKEDLIKALNQLKNIQLKKLYKELGLKVDENGRVVERENFLQKQKEFSEKYLIDENTTQDIIDALKVGVPVDYLIPLQNLILNKLSSLTRKPINTIKVLGGQLIQTPQWGFLAPNNIAATFKDDVHQTKSGQYYFYRQDKSKLESKGVRFFKDGFNGVQKQNYLMYESDGKKIVRPFECLTTTNFVRKQIPELANASDETIISLLNEKPHLRRILASRIPNQAVASNHVMEIVGILPSYMGDSIVSYLDMTRISGSDFDIDKLYVVFPYLKYVNGELKLIKPQFGEKATQRQIVNYILQTLIQLGMDERLRKEYFTKSIDTHVKEDILFNGFKEAPKNLSELTKDDFHFTPDNIRMKDEDIYKNPIILSRDGGFNMFTILHQMRVEESAMQAKDLLSRLIILRKSLLSMIDEPVAIANKLPFTNTFEENPKFTKFAYEYSPEILGKKFESSEILSEETNLTVDNMKSMVLPSLNVNIYTSNIWTASIAHTLNPELVCCLFTQDAMRYFSEEKANLEAEGNIVKAGSKELQRLIIGRILFNIDGFRDKKYILDLSSHYKNKILSNKSYLPLKEVAILKNIYEKLRVDGKTDSSEFKNMDKYFKSKEYAALQLAILDIINILDTIGEIDSNFILTTKTNISNKDPFSLITSLLKYSSLINKTGDFANIYKPERYFFNKNGDPKFESIFSIFSQRDLYNVFKSFYNEFNIDVLNYLVNSYKTTTGQTLSNPKEIKSIYDLIKLKTLLSCFDKSFKGVDFYISKYFSGKNTIFDDYLKVYSMLSSKKVNNPILDNLTIRKYKNHYRFEIISYKIDKLSKDELISGMRQLLFFNNSNLTKEENSFIREFGKDLAIQAILTSNGKFSPFSLKEYIPMDFYKIIGYYDKINKVFSNQLDLNFDEVIEYGIKSGFIYVPFINIGKKSKSKIISKIKENTIDGIISISAQDLMSNSNAKINLQERFLNSNIMYNIPRFIRTNISSKTHLYKLEGFRKYLEDGIVRADFIYSRVEKVGIKQGSFNVQEFGLSTETLKTDSGPKMNGQETNPKIILKDYYELKEPMTEKIQEVIDPDIIISELKELSDGRLINLDNVTEEYKNNCGKI